jgi:hypothetical protein
MIPVSPADLALKIAEQEEYLLELEQLSEEEIKDKKEGGESGEKAKGDEGKMGSTETKEQNRRNQIKGLEQKITQMSSGQKETLAADTVSDMMGAMSGLSGMDAISTGSLEAFTGNMNGAVAGNAAGMGGLGGVGFGAGGGGSGRFYGGGGLGTIGSGGGGKGYGNGEGNTGTRRARKPRMIAMTPKVDGGNLPREVIRRVIMSRAGAYQNCYEKELTAKRNLSGKIEMMIKISGSGKVLLAKVHNSTMNNSKVEKCISRNIKRLKFPKPKNGKMVKVRYPFRFKSGG